MKRVYLAASFAYTDKEQKKKRCEAIDEVVTTLKLKGLDVYVPHEMKIPNAWDYTMQEWGLMVFSRDVAEIDKSDLVVMLSWGKENNAGAAWEVGYAFAKGKKVVVVAMSEAPQSLMVLHGSYAQVKHENLFDYDFDTMPKSREITGVES